MPTKKVFINIAVYSPRRKRLALVKSDIDNEKYGFLRSQLERGYTVTTWARKCVIEEFMIAPHCMIELDLYQREKFKTEFFFLVISDEYIPELASAEDREKFHFLAVHQRLMNKSIAYKADEIVDNIPLYELVRRVVPKGWTLKQIHDAVDAIMELEEFPVHEDTMKKLRSNIPFNPGVVATCSFGFWFQAYSYVKRTFDKRYNPLYAKNGTSSKANNSW